MVITVNKSEQCSLFLKENELQVNCLYDIYGPSGARVIDRWLLILQKQRYYVWDNTLCPIENDIYPDYKFKLSTDTITISNI